MIASFESADGIRCVDVFSTASGKFSFDEWRRDPEDPSGWHPTGVAGRTPHDSSEAALDAARHAVPWLAVERP